MTGLHRGYPTFLIDSAGAAVGLVGRDGREWLFPAPLTLAADGGASLSSGRMLYDDTGTPQGITIYGREFSFGSAFTLNTTAGLRRQARPFLVNASGVPIGVAGAAIVASIFPTPPTESGGSGGGSLTPTFSGDFTGSLPTGVTFSRASTSTAIVGGTLTALTSGTPAFESWNGRARGLRVNGAAANQLTFSNVFTNAAWTKSTGTVAAGADLGPDGATLMAQFSEGVASGLQAVSQTLASTAAGVTQTLSVFVRRPAGCTRFAVMLRMAPQFNNTGFRGIFRYDGTTGHYGLTDANVTVVGMNFIPLGGGIYLLSITGTWTTTSLKTFMIHSLDETQTTIYNAYAGNTSQGPELWGAQVSIGAGLASYCDNPTTATGTVAAETAVIATPTWLDTTRGTFIITHDCQSGVILGSGTNAVVTATGSVMPATGTKTAFAWDSGGSDFLNNGQATTAGGVPTFGSDIRFLGTSAVANFGHILRVDYYPTRLSVAQMQTLTAPVSTATPGVKRIASRQRMPSYVDALTGTQLSLLVRADCPILGATGCSQLFADFAGIVFPGTATGNSVFVDALYLERVGAVNESVQVKFGGSGTATVLSGAQNFLSDAILPSSFTGITSFAPSGTSGDTYYWNLIVHVAAAGQFTPNSRWSTEPNAVMFGYDPGAAAPSRAISGTGAITITGPHTTPSRGMAPILVGIPVTGDPKSAFLLGDSIFEGTGSYQGYTWIEKACVANNIPCLMFCKGGQSQTQVYNQALWKTYLAYARILVDDFGTNDVNHQLYFFDSWQAAKNTYGYDKLVHVGLFPNATTSSDSWATLGGQTGIRAYPADIDSMLASAAFNGLLDVNHPMTSTRDGTNAAAWKTNGTAFAYTLEGTHPFTVLSDAATTAEASAILAALTVT